jgi:hypothetical protein
MVNLAETKAVRNSRLSLRMAIGENVRGVKKFDMPQMADSALLAVCA